MILAVVGMVIYSWAVEVEKQAANNTKGVPNVKNSLTEEEIRLLKEGVDSNASVKDVQLGESKVQVDYSHLAGKEGKQGI